MSRQQLELLVNDDSLQVPFGIVELQAAEGQSVDLNIHCQPPAPAVPEDIRTVAENACRIILPDEWFRLVFYYVSLTAYEPITNVEEISTQEAWQSTLAAARLASPNRPIANTLVFDGLPAAENCFPRTVSQAAFHAIHRMMRWTDLQWRALPYDCLIPALSPAKVRTPGGKEATPAKIFVVFYSDPGKSWDQIQKIKTQLSDIPEFFDQLRPSNQEMVPGITYLQVDNTGGDPVCQSRSLSPDQGQIISEPIAHIRTSIPWSSMVFGDNLAIAILDAYDLSVSLPPPGDGRRWPADCPEYPSNWLTRSLDNPIPPYPREPDSSIATYPKGADKLELDRWLFWTWQCGRWGWNEICQAAIQFGELARNKIGTGINPDQTKTAKTRAANYAEWMGYKLRLGKSGSGQKKRAV